MSTDEILDAEVEFEKSRTTSVRLLESLAQKIGARRAARQAAYAAGPGPGGLPWSFDHDPSRVVLRFVRRPAVAALAAVAAGFLLVTALRQLRR